MNTAASGLLGIFKAIGKVGWMLLITGAVEALSFLYDKFFGSDKEDAEQAENVIRKLLQETFDHDAALLADVVEEEQPAAREPLHIEAGGGCPGVCRVWRGVRSECFLLQKRV